MHESKSTTKKKKSYGRSSKKTVLESHYDEWLSGGEIESGGRLSVKSNLLAMSGGKLSSGVGTKLDTSEIDLSSRGHISAHSRSMSHKNALRSKGIASSNSHYKAGATRLEGDIKLGSSVSSVRADLSPSTSKEGEDDMGLRAALSSLPAGAVIDIRTVRDKKGQTYKKSRSLSPKLANLVQIGGGVVTALTAGTAAPVTGLASAGAASASTSALTAASSAAMSAALSTAGTSLAFNAYSENSLGKAAGATFNRKGVRSIGKSALAAGASTYISSQLVPKLDTGASYTDVGVHAFKRGVISAGVSAGVYHASLEDGLKDAAVTGVTAMAHKAAGDVGVARGYEEGSTEKLAMHGIIGAGSAALGGALKGRESKSVKRSAIAGFASGAVAEYMSGRAAKEAQEARELSGNASAFSDDALSAPRESTYEHLTPLAGAVAALAAGGSPEDMHMGARIAVSAREYNYMAHAAAMASRVAGLAGGSVGGALVGTDSLTSTKSTLETSLGSASSLDGLDAGDLKWGGTISTPDQRQEIDELTKQSGYGEGLGRDLDRFTHPGYAEGYGEDLSHRIFGGAVLPGFTELGERGVLGRFIRPDRGFDTLPEYAPDMSILFKKNEGGGTFKQGDNIDLDRFKDRVKISGQRAKLIDPKTKQYIEPDRGRNTGVGGHGGSAWKLYDKSGKLVGTLSKEGKLLRLKNR